MAQTVAEIMEGDPPAVTPDQGVEDVVRIFKRSDVAALPVVNEAGRCVGIVTENDLVIADEAGDLHLPHYIELFGGIVFLEPLRHFDERLRKAAAATVHELMTAEPVTVAPTATVREAAHLITTHDHNHLPVVEHGRLVGLVTRADVLAALTAEE